MIAAAETPRGYTHVKRSRVQIHSCFGVSASTGRESKNNAMVIDLVLNKYYIFSSIPIAIILGLTHFYFNQRSI